MWIYVLLCLRHPDDADLVWATLRVFCFKKQPACILQLITQLRGS